MKAKIILPLALLVTAGVVLLALLLGPLSETGDSTVDLAPAEGVSEEAGDEPAPAGEPVATAPGGEGKTPAPTEVVEDTVEGDPEPGASRLHGAVLDRADDRPLEGVRIRLFLAGGEETVAETHSDATGRYEIRGLDTGRVYRWIASKEGYAEERGGRLSFPEDTRDFELRPFRMGPAGTLAGTVHAKSGGPLAGATVRMDPLAKTPEGISYPARDRGVSVTADDAGAFEHRALPAGRFRVMAEAEGYARQVVNGVEVAAGKRETLEFALEPEAGLSGTVRDKNGTPLKGARVTGTYSGRRGTFEIPEVVTGEDGRFAVRHVPPDPRVLARAHHGG
jgi:hypothetical protein